MPTIAAHAVLFDLDGTLLDSTGAYLEIMRRACERLGWPAPGPELMRAVMTHRQRPIEALFGPCDDADAREQALFAATAEIWESAFTALARPFPHTLELLRGLHRAGVRLGIVTDANDHIAASIAGLPGCPPFETIVTRARAGARKPDPAGIRLALAEMGIAPQCALYVGDNPCDVEAAHGAGVRAVGITTGSSLHADLAACAPHAIVDSLESFAAQVTYGPPALGGTLATGQGKAGGFLEIDWVRTQVRALLGGEFHPGTLNLRLTDPAAAVATRARQDPRHRAGRIHPQGDFCAAHCHAVDLHGPAGTVPALTLWPEVDGYPATQLELICAVPLREHWKLRDGDALTVSYHPA